MNYCAKLILILSLLPSLLWGQILSHTHSKNHEFSTVHIESSQPAHLNPEGITLDSKPLIANQDIPLPTTVTFKTPLSASKLIVYACLNNGQCLKPYEVTLEPATEASLTQIIFTSFILAFTTVFNPCLAPLWLVVSSQFKRHLLAYSFAMGSLLLLYQSLLQIFGTQLITLMYQMGVTEASYSFLIVCLILVLFSNKITLPTLVKNHGQWPSLIAIILSSSCLLPLQLSAAGSTRSMPLDVLIIGALIFYFCTSLGFWVIANISQQIYRKAMAFTPIALYVMATVALVYLFTQHGFSPTTVICLMMFISYLAFKPPINQSDLIVWVILSGTILMQSWLPQSHFGHTLKEINQAKIQDNQILYVVADWCPTCQTLKSKPPANVLWLDITHASTEKEQWMHAHQVSFLPSCFISKNHKWLPCSSKDC